MTTSLVDGRLYGPAGWTEPLLKGLAEAALIPADYESGDFYRFNGMTGHTLLSIVDGMDFPDEVLENRQNGGPRLKDVLMFARAWPDFIKVFGYVVTRDRRDERLTIDEIDIEVPTVYEAPANAAIALIDECPLYPPYSRNMVLSGGLLHMRAWWD